MHDDMFNPYRPPVVTDGQPVAQPENARVMIRDFVPGGKLVKTLIALFWCTIALSGIGLVSWAIIVFAELSGQADTWLASWAVEVSGVILGMYIAFAVQVATVIAFCKWFHRAYANVQYAFQVGGLQYSPNWASGAFFIPFINLVVPYRVAREIWVGSQPGIQSVSGARAVSDSSSWIEHWWGLFLLMNALQVFDFYMAIGNITYIINFLFPGVAIVAALVTMRMITQIDRLQRKRSTTDNQATLTPEDSSRLPEEIIHRCSSCSAPYDPDDYSELATHIYCASCKAELPRNI